LREPHGKFEQLVEATLRNEQEMSGGSLKYHSSPLKGDRRYHFLSGDKGSLEVATIPTTDDAEWTFVNHGWVDQDPRWNQFQGDERNEEFIRSKARELRVRLGLPWPDSGA
jgi:hypothetical protein